MKAILIATGYQAKMEPLIHFRPTPMMQIAGKPIIIHIIEFLSRQGIKNFEIILCNLPELIERKLEDGKRWGVAITYHLVKDHEFPFSTIIYAADSWKKESVLLGQGDSLPEFTPKSFSKNKNLPTLFMFSKKKWSGWGLFSTDFFKNLSPYQKEKEFLSDIIGHTKSISIKPYISTRSLSELKKSNQKAISSQVCERLHHTSAKMVEPNIWISRSVSIHPSAKVIPPIYIGENSQIKAGTLVGPNSIIERSCIIDNNSTVQNSLICSRSYIGEGLDIQNSIVDRNILINLSLNTVLKIRDDFILSELSAPSIYKLPLIIFERFLAFLLCVFFSPLYLLLLLNHNIKKTRVLFLPADSEKALWTEFEWLSFEKKNKKKLPNKFEAFFVKLPTLWNVFYGEAHFVGVSPLPLFEVEKLPPEWKKLYITSKVGLITLAELDYGKSVSLDNRYTSEAYYATYRRRGFDFKLFIRWIKNKINALFNKHNVGKERDPYDN
jgi:NDP-sugar pyrophosphorylase family protein